MSRLLATITCFVVSTAVATAGELVALRPSDVQVLVHSDRDCPVGGSALMVMRREVLADPTATPSDLVIPPGQVFMITKVDILNDAVDTFVAVSPISANGAPRTTVWQTRVPNPIDRDFYPGIPVKSGMVVCVGPKPGVVRVYVHGYLTADR